MSTTTRSHDRPPRTIARELAAAPIDPLTYRSLAYLLLAFPLAVIYFTVAVTGASLTLGLSVTLLGPLALVATLLAFVSLAWLDGALTEGLLEAEVAPAFPTHDDGVVPFLTELFLGRGTWLGAVYLLWKTLLGFVAFVAIVTALSLAASLLAAPLFYGDHVVVGTYSVHTLERALVASAGGLAIGYLTLVLVNLTGRLAAVVASALLTPE
ncbi:histidine kinase [Salinadaptatus halalkaliphilus]|uniref:Histidine kinase n=1 Tax=Salinadaptatus halalkaliphilus TaxID=2419781 RepID=A0A4S3TIW5_9EURY|nr:sensor domain-containing protein [Salinadaptatus halalkaliphilus]THE63902.1 histidine kinase [Salinadaptatus halalkaliphilus]